MMRFPFVAIGGVLVLCGVVAGMGMYWHDSSAVVQFLILAGLVVNYIDRHAQNSTLAVVIPAAIAETVAAKADEVADKISDKAEAVAQEILEKK